MTIMMEYLLAAVLVAVVLFVTYRAANYGSRRRVEKDFKSPEDILEAVNIYRQYGRKRAAIQLLERGLENHPAHPALEAMLAELNGDAS